MKARLLAVQRALLMVLVTACVVAGLSVPRAGDRELSAALSELHQFEAEFVRSDAERTLRDRAAASRALPLSELKQALEAELSPKLEIRAAESTLPSLATVKLANLGDVSRFAKPGAQVAVASPDVAQIARALAFRLKRLKARGTLTLESAQLVVSDVSVDQIQREQAISALEEESARATTAVQRAGLKLERATQRLEARRKRRARSVAEYQELYTAAKESFDQKAARDVDLSTRFARELALVEGFRALGQANASELSVLPERAAVRVRVALSSATRTFDLPVSLNHASVQVAPLTFANAGRGFAAVRATAMWPQLAELEAAPAASRLRSKLHWQFKQLPVAGFHVSGAHVLHVLPCLLVIALAYLLRTMRRAAVAHSPFTARAITSLPRVGLRYRLLELLVVVLLPLVAIACAALSLWMLGQLPIVPAVAAVACAVLGSDAFMKLQDLRDLSVSIMQYHSYPPPPMLTGSTTAITRL